MRHVNFTAVAAVGIMLVFAPRNSLAETSGTPELRKLDVPGSQIQAIATRLSLRYRDLPGISISPDATNHQLVVMAPEAAQQQIAADVQTLLSSSVVRQASAFGPVKIQLHHRSWAEFEDDLKQIAGTPLPITTSRNGERASFQLHATPLQGTTVEVDRRNNQVTVTAPNSSQAGWREIIKTIDSPATRQSDVMQLFRFENAEAAPVQRAIRLLGELEANDSNPRRLTPVDANNALKNALFQQDAADGTATPTPQTDADPNNPDEITEEVTVGGSGVIGDTQIQFVPELGTIIIRGAKRDVQRVMDVIKEIEKQSEVTRPDVEVVQLQHADSNAVATLLAQLYSDVLSARQGEVSITALDSPNALLLIGRTEAINNVRDLIAKVDQPIEESSRLRIFRLQHASASDAEEIIRDFFTARPGEDDDLRPALGARVRISADYRTNSLVIAAAPRDMSEVIRLINDLDVKDIPSKSEIKIFKLNNAIAEDLAPVIQEAISGESDVDGDGNIVPPSSTLSIVAVDAEGSRILDSGILAGAIVTADTGANSIVVRAPSSSMPLISELISQLDRAPGIDSLVKVFTIENGDATQLTTALEQLFGSEAATSGTSVGAGNLGGLPSTTSGGDSSLVPLRFSTDLRTNSIIASGSADDLEVVESILLRLDTEGFSERITEVIWLRHQNAENIAAAIQDYVSQRSTRLNTIQQFQQGGLGPFDLPDRDLIVVAEPISNSLLLSVSPRLYEDVRRLIDKLDRRPPMVLIKVLLAEVRLADFFEIGGEVGLQDSLLFDRGVATGAIPAANPQSNPGFQFNNNATPNVNSFGQENVAGRGLSSFGVGAANGNLNYGGFVLSAASESVSLLLRTLQNAERLQILSRPQIMTMDNTEGFVQVGRQIARVTGVINNGISGSQVVTEDIEVGLIMRVRPRVGADGLIVMDIDATRSARDDNNGTVIPTGDGQFVTVDDILRTTAQSTVAAYSGQTVIFGGLIQKTRTNQSRRVPYLADIPLLGYFFKYDQEFEERNELLVVMTPMLITGEEDLEYVKTVESSRMSWCLADVVEMHGDVGLSGGYGLWGPATGGTIYPDLQPTVDLFDAPACVDDVYLSDPSAPSVILNDPNMNASPGLLDTGVSLDASGGFNHSHVVPNPYNPPIQTAPTSPGMPRPAERSGPRINPLSDGASPYDSGEFSPPPVQNPTQFDQSNATSQSPLSQAAWQQTVQKPKSSTPVRLGTSGNNP